MAGQGRAGCGSGAGFTPQDRSAHSWAFLAASLAAAVGAEVRRWSPAAALLGSAPAAAVLGVLRLRVEVEAAL